MSLGRLIKKNFVLTVGLGLPVIMVLVFLLGSALPRLTTPAPEYAAIFAVQNYRLTDYNVKYFVDQETIKAKIDKRDDAKPQYAEDLYIYNPQKNELRKIDFTPTEGNKTVTVENAKSLKVDTKETSPDGYQFARHNRSRSGGIFFFDGGYREGYRIFKGSASYNIPDNFNHHYNNARFIGWAMP